MSDLGQQGDADQERLSRAARTLSMQDDSLGSPPTSEANVSASLDGDAASLQGSTTQPSRDLSSDRKNSNPDEQITSAKFEGSGGSLSERLALASPSSSPHFGKRSVATAERTGSDASDPVLQRTEHDAAQPAPDIAKRSTALTSQRKNSALSPMLEGEADEAAATASQPSDSTRSKKSNPNTQDRRGPFIFFGGSQAQGSRDHFEDRYAIQADFQPGPAVVSPDDLANGKPAAASGSNLHASFAGVYDGHSAADAAQTASQRLHVLLAGELGAAQADEAGLNCTAVEAALHRTFAAMDFEILSESARTGARCGSTACVALQLGEDLYAAHAGDSIAILDRGGKVVKLTAVGDHKVSCETEAARIKSKGGVIMAGGERVVSPRGRHSLNMSRALGDADYKTPHRIVSAQPDVSSTRLTKEDTAIILGTDGLWDVMRTKDAIAVVSTALGGEGAQLKAKATGQAAASLARAAAEALVSEAVRRGSGDNITAVVGLVRWPDAVGSPE